MYFCFTYSNLNILSEHFDISLERIFSLIAVNIFLFFKIICNIKGDGVYFLKLLKSY